MCGVCGNLSPNLFLHVCLQDPTSKQAYKDLVAMDQSFKRLVAVIEETGEARNAILELEIKIEQLKGKVDALNVERLEKDYQAMKAENIKLVKQFRASTRRDSSDD